MKSIFLTFIGSAILVLSAESQVSHNFNASDYEPYVEAKISKDQVPAAVVEAVKLQFSENNPHQCTFLSIIRGHESMF